MSPILKLKEAKVQFFIHFFIFAIYFLCLCLVMTQTSLTNIKLGPVTDAPHNRHGSL